MEWGWKWGFNRKYAWPGISCYKSKIEPDMMILDISVCLVPYFPVKLTIAWYE